MDSTMNLSPLASLDSTDGSISDNGKSVMNYMQLQHMNIPVQRNELYMLNSKFCDSTACSLIKLFLMS